MPGPTICVFGVAGVLYAKPCIVWSVGVVETGTPAAGRGTFNSGGVDTFWSLGLNTSIPSSSHRFAGGVRVADLRAVNTGLGSPLFMAEIEPAG
jgi:hypothetical protein